MNATRTILNQDTIFGNAGSFRQALRDTRRAAGRGTADDCTQALDSCDKTLEDCNQVLNDCQHVFA